MVSYQFDEGTESFLIQDYNKSKPFASFLPGIAGKNGIPLWVFYVNRGQCISSFGIQDKNNAIMEFFPANQAYKMTSINGFRTFYKLKNHNSSSVREVFSVNSGSSIQNLKIRPDNFRIEERTLDGLKFVVTYFILPNEDFAALIRKVTIENISPKALSLEILDGIAQILPFGVNYETSKFMSYTSTAWMTADNLENDISFFKMSMSSGDTTEVSQIYNGNFCISFEDNKNQEKILKPIVDPSIIFGNDTSLANPIHFTKKSIKELYSKHQITEGKIPCHFVGTELNLDPSKSQTIYSIIGQVNNINWINDKKEEIVNIKYISQKEKESQKIIRDIMNNIGTRTNNKIFDLYCKQTYLDNVLRGGFPVVFKSEKMNKVIHIYIRKHGDQERDYNWFYLEPREFSQGNGNFRDINQNRRCDVFFNPQVEDFNIKTFMNLIQADGYNPLIITGSTFKVLDKNIPQILSLIKNNEKRIQFESFLKTSFSIGKLIEFIKNKRIELKTSLDGFLDLVMRYSKQILNAVHGEGYWIDHWTYNLDLILNYLAIYPEKEKHLLFVDKTYTFYDNFVFVQPREEKYILIDGKIRQYGHLFKDSEKERLINQRKLNKHFLREKNGKGKVYKTSLFVKLISLITNKFACLDPLGMGIEMEAGKPGWYDALNGLPGIFGSSMAETYELKHICNFIVKILKKYRTEITEVSLPIEIYHFISNINLKLAEYYGSSKTDKDHIYWDSIASIREQYRKEVFYGFKGKEKVIATTKLVQFVEALITKIDEGINRALQLNDNIFPTYFYFEAKEYSILKNPDGSPKKNEKEQINVQVQSFIPHVLPIFLEGFVRALKIHESKKDSRNIWKKVRNSPLYDHKLKMYKLNASLSETTHEIGRAQGFTTGWLENGSIWMHMEYKYLLELLNNQLYDEFYEDFHQTLIPFQDPQQYGRPTTENSSFICSSDYPDEKLHGTGFYARLSGSTAEFLNIWMVMMIGRQPFFINQENKLCLRFQPKLANWLFTKNNTIKFNFLNSCTIIYHNPNRKHTYRNCSISKIKLWKNNNSQIDITGGIIMEPFSLQVREGLFPKIEVFLD